PQNPSAATSPRLQVASPEPTRAAPSPSRAARPSRPSPPSRSPPSSATPTPQTSPVASSSPIASTPCSRRFSDEPEASLRDAGVTAPRFGGPDAAARARGPRLG